MVFQRIVGGLQLFFGFILTFTMIIFGMDFSYPLNYISYAIALIFFSIGLQGIINFK